METNTERNQLKYFVINQPLEKKIPKNPKFENVKPLVKTGKHANNIYYMSEAEKQKRKKEIFKRINTRSLARWIESAGPSESIYDLVDEVNDENCFKGNVINPNQSGAMSIFGGEGSPSKKLIYDSQQESKFLLLDLRTQTDYNQFHIKESVNFPSRLINQDRYPSDLYKFKNKPNKWIVIYGDDDRIIEPIADQLVRKGIDNMMMLTGGIGRFSVRFPDFIVGDIPEGFLESLDPEVLGKEYAESILAESKMKMGSTYTLDTGKTPCLKMSKLPKKDLLVRQKKMNDKLKVQNLTNPSQKSDKELTLKPFEYNNMNTGSPSIVERKLNFTKKPLVSKIK